MEIQSAIAGLQAKSNDSLSKDLSSPIDRDNDEAWKMAKKFEAAFIAQMLVHSGFAKALTSSGGEDVAGFSQFYMESLAQDMTERGGFGIAEDIYSNIKAKEAKHDDLGRM